MNQPDLDFSLRARTTDPDTAHAAAAFAQGNAKTRAATMYHLIVASGERGCAKDDFEDQMPGVPVVCFSPIPARLKEKGLIVDSGERRKGRAGVGQIVWKAVNPSGVTQ